MQKKYGEGEVRTHDLLTGKQNNQAPVRVRTQDLQPDCCNTVVPIASKSLHGVEIKWSFGRIC